MQAYAQQFTPRVGRLVVHFPHHHAPRHDMMGGAGVGAAGGGSGSWKGSSVVLKVSCVSCQGRVSSFGRALAVRDVSWLRALLSSTNVCATTGRVPPHKFIWLNAVLVLHTRLSLLLLSVPSRRSVLLPVFTLHFAPAVQQQQLAPRSAYSNPATPLSGNTPLGGSPNSLAVSPIAAAAAGAAGAAGAGSGGSSGNGLDALQHGHHHHQHLSPLPEQRQVQVGLLDEDAAAVGPRPADDDASASAGDDAGMLHNLGYGLRHHAGHIQPHLHPHHYHQQQQQQHEQQ